MLLPGCIPAGYERPVGAGLADDRPRQVDRDPSDPVERPALPDQRPLDDGVVGVPNPKPAWEARPVTADAAQVDGSEYVVGRGDTLRSIGNATGAGSEAIARANGIEPPFMIQPGQRLTIPAGRYHLVQAGQTGIAIARAYGIDWSRIVTANQLAEPYVLRVGQRVVIPGDAAVPRTPAERAAAFRLDIEDLVTGAEPAQPEGQRPARAVVGTTRRLAPTTPIAAPAAFTSGFAWPLRGTIVNRFGRGASGVRNDGIKIATPLDTPVRAAADGTVAYAGTGVAGLGGLVMLRHGGGWTSVYGHASRLLVQRGQAVKQGDIVAYSGDSGFADRPELHFELRQGRTAVDPLTRLPR